MKNKRGQFYLVTVVLLIGLFVGVLMLQNNYKKEKNVTLEDLNKEISLEKNKLLDHVAYNNLDPSSTNAVFNQFSNEYSNKIGNTKNILFLFGNSTNIKIIGKIQEDNIFSYNNGTNTTGLNAGDISVDLTSLSNISILIDDYQYPFSFSTTQNIYYIIRHDYNNEVHIISG